MSHLLRYNASAGSGKTYTLVQLFLVVTLSGRPRWHYDAYSHILCITFTKKATAEMKQRIISQLYMLSHLDLEEELPATVVDLLENITRYSGEKLDVATLRDRARESLHHLLHHYSFLNISTIDSFIQRIFVSLIWELDLTPEFSPSIDSVAFLQKATRRLLQDMSPGSALYTWCSERAERKVLEGRSWRLERMLPQRGFQLFEDRFTLQSESARREFFSVEHFQHIRSTLESEQKRIEKALRDLCTELETQFAANHLDSEAFKYKKNSGWCILKRRIENMHVGGLDVLSARSAAFYESEVAWTNDPTWQSLLARECLPTYRLLCDSIRSQRIWYNTVRLAQRSLSELALLGELRSALITVENQEKSKLLNNIATLLCELAQDNDTSFIYEKMGLRFHSVLIDEFQDTSGLHWQLLHPLVDNALSVGGMGMLVGDVKQAIYRWRGGDWSLLAQEIPAQYERSFGISSHELRRNYRSGQRIVEFNNTIFEEIVTHAPDFLENSLQPDESTPLPFSRDEFAKLLQHDVYPDLQQSDGGDGAGYVSFTLLNSEETDNKSEATEDATAPEISYTLSLLADCIARGIAPEDIAILLRRRKTAQAYAEALLGAGYDVVSQDALLLDASSDVALMLAVLRLSQQNELDTSHIALETALLAQYLDENRARFDFSAYATQPWTAERPESPSALLAAALSWLASLKTLPLLELFDSIAQGLNLPSTHGEMPYLATLRDLVYDYQRTHSNDTTRFLEDYLEQDASQRQLDCPPTPNAIHVLTIHKSKGLQFGVVICPEIQNVIVSPWNDDILWNEIQFPDGSSELLPHGVSKAHLQSLFAPSICREYAQSLIDAINLFYVALTRAKNELYIITRDVSNQRGTDAAKLFLEALQGYAWSNSEPIEGGTNFYYGELPSKREVPKSESTTVVGGNSIVCPFQNARLRVHMLVGNGNEDLATLLLRSESTELGNSLHKLMTQINSTADLPHFSTELVRNQICNVEIAERIAESIRQSIATEPLLANAYREATDRRIWVEHDFVDADGKLLRPDRVVVSDSETLVIDFKFGSARNEYRSQVQRYVRLLEELEFPTPQGLLWYIPPGGDACRVEIC